MLRSVPCTAGKLFSTPCNDRSVRPITGVLPLNLPYTEEPFSFQQVVKFRNRPKISGGDRMIELLVLCRIKEPHQNRAPGIECGVRVPHCLLELMSAHVNGGVPGKKSTCRSRVKSGKRTLIVTNFRILSTSYLNETGTGSIPRALHPMRERYAVQWPGPHPISIMSPRTFNPQDAMSLRSARHVALREPS